MVEKTPKIFISYSWTASDRVLELAERLMASGVDVVLDRWELIEGHDKYVFMEQCVTNPEIDKVLLICDKAYMEKANSRTGGVGDETTIISPEVYGKAGQEKFLPVVFEVDEYNKPYLPVFVKSRLYFDLSTDDDRYESEYEKLLRNLHNKPLYKKPALGKKPEWLENEMVDLSPIRDLIRQVRGYTGGNMVKADFLLRNAISSILIALQEFKIPQMDDEVLLIKIEEMKPLRDLCVEFFEAVIYSGLPLTDTVTSLFEQIYNSTHDVSGASGANPPDFEHYDFFIWETFISMTAVLFYYEKYAELHDVLNHAYFLRTSFYDESNVREYGYSTFRKYMSTIEGTCKTKCDEPQLFTLTGRMLTQREKKPILTAQALSRADVLLYQLHVALDLSDYDKDWFPTSYIYFKGGDSMWIRLKSKKYCQKIMPLFGANTIEALTDKISKSVKQREMRYPHSFDSAPAILDSIRLSDIGSLN